MSWSYRLCAVACIALLGACERVDETQEPDQSPSAPVSEVLPVVDPPLDRAELLLAMTRAASDFAAGRDDAARQRTLDGRLFEVPLRFGCTGTTDETRTWTFDEATGVLRLRVEPDLTIGAPAVRDLGFSEFEAIEGFWLQRPWLLDSACPASDPSPEATGEAAPSEAADDSDDSAPEEQTTPAAPRFGIAHFYTADDSRTLRRDSRAYQATRKLAAGEAPSTEGYDLVLSGRMSRMPDGRVIACAGRNPDRPPTCVVSVTFDRVAIRRPGGEIVADWSSG